MLCSQVPQISSCQKTSFLWRVLTTPEVQFFISRNDVKPLENTGKFVASDAVFPSAPHPGAALLLSMAQCLKPRAQPHGPIGAPRCREWRNAPSGFLSVRVPQRLCRHGWHSPSATRLRDLQHGLCPLRHCRTEASTTRNTLDTPKCL